MTREPTVEALQERIRILEEERKLREAEYAAAHIQLESLWNVSALGDADLKKISSLQAIVESKQAEEAQLGIRIAAQRLADEQAALAEIGRVIGATLQIEQVYEQFGSVTRRLIPSDAININLIDAARGVFSVAYYAGTAIPGLERGSVIPLAGTMTEYMMQRGAATIVNISEPEELILRYPGLRNINPAIAAFRSNMLIPLISNDLTIGIIHFRTAAADVYSDEDLRLAEQIGMQIAGAIDSARLYRDLLENRAATERLAREQAALAEIGRVISSTLILERVFDQFSHITQKLIHFDTLSVNLLDSEGGQFQVAYLTGIPIPGLTVGRTLPIARTLTSRVVEKKCAVIINTPTTIEALQRLCPEMDRTLSIQAGFRSHMQIPLFSNDIMIANLHFRSKTEAAYGEEDLKLAERIGMQIAGSIANAQLFANQVQAEADKKKLLDQLLQSQKMESVGRLAGGVAHDFNNMLALILGHMEIALEQVGPENPLRENLQQIEKAAQRSAELTRQLLAFARKQTILPKVLDLTEVVEGSLKMLRRLIGEDIQLAWLPGSKLWPIRVDPSQIDQILANLCVNARDAIAGVGQITIETANVTMDAESCLDNADARPGDYVCLAVGDDGHGMDPETLSHLFEPFFTTKEVGKGTGLGLATVFGIVKQNGGFIDVHSQPGERTTFRICLPRHRGTTEQEGADGAPEPVMRGRETVLVVEDEPDLLKLNTYMLEKLGYRVIGASSPGEAVRLAEEQAGKIHLLLTDVVMPEMNGRDLARKLLSLYPDMKRLFMSGYTGDVIADRGVLIDGAYFIQKPFSRSALAAKVREALDRDETAN